MTGRADSTGSRIGVKSIFILRERLQLECLLNLAGQNFSQFWEIEKTAVAFLGQKKYKHYCTFSITNSEVKLHFDHLLRIRRF